MSTKAPMPLELGLRTVMPTPESVVMSPRPCLEGESTRTDLSATSVCMALRPGKLGQATFARHLNQSP
jgi:hypothetical protein